MRTALSLQSVSRTFGIAENAVAALRNVTLEVAEGEFVAVMGASGSGKSTLLAIAGALDTGASGEVLIAGQPTAGLNAKELARLRRRRVGFVFQDYNLVPTLTVVENVGLPLELDGVRQSSAREQSLAALAKVGIEELADRRLDQVSGGQRQRVAIARAIVGERRLVLADEPTGALDSVTGDDVMAVLRQLADDGMAVVVVTHEARHAAWADRVVFLRDGRIVDSTASENRPEALLAGAE